MNLILILALSFLMSESSYASEKGIAKEEKQQYETIPLNRINPTKGYTIWQEPEKQQTVRWYSFYNNQMITQTDTVPGELEITVSPFMVNWNDYGKVMLGLHAYNLEIEDPRYEKSQILLNTPEKVKVELTGERLVIIGMEHIMETTGSHETASYFKTLEQDTYHWGARRAFVVLEPTKETNVALEAFLSEQGFISTTESRDLTQQKGSMTFFMKEFQEPIENSGSSLEWKQDLNDPGCSPFLENFGIFVRGVSGFVQGGATGEILCDAVTPHAEIGNFFMDESIRGTGQGRLVMNFVEVFVKTQNIHSIELSTSDHQAPWFYEKIGYRKLATLPKWLQRRGGGYVSAYTYHKVV